VHLLKLTLLMVSFSLMGGIQSSAAITLDELIYGALQTYPTILSKQASKEAASTDVTAAKLRFLPNPSVGTQRNQVAYNGQSSSSLPATNVTISQPLFMGGGLIAGYNKADARLSAADFALLETREDVSKRLISSYAEWLKAQEDLNAQEQILADREELLDHTDIIAPATGIVKSIKVTTLGGVIRQGDEILQILPTESDLIVEAKVKPSDMANIKAGLPAKVKLDAFDYAIFGSMNGKVTYVSADTLSEETKSGPMTYYRVKVSIQEKEFKGDKSAEIEVRPGMTATVDIKTGKRSVLSYLTKPLTKTFTESFGER